MTNQTEKESFRDLVPRAQHDQPIVLLDDPPLGHLQAIVLKKFSELGGDAFGYNVLEQLSEEVGVRILHSQIYSSIRKLLNRPKPLIEITGTRPSKEGPSIKIYKLTAEGRTALKATAAHHRAVADYLTNNKRKATRN